MVIIGDNTKFKNTIFHLHTLTLTKLCHFNIFPNTEKCDRHWPGLNPHPSGSEASGKPTEPPVPANQYTKDLKIYSKLEAIDCIEVL